MKDSRGSARPRASIPSPLSAYSMTGESTMNSPPEIAAHMGPKTPPTATVHHGPKTFLKFTRPQGGQLRVVNEQPNPKVMVGDYRPCYSPYHHENWINNAQDVRDGSRRNTDLAWNMHWRQVYRAYAPKPCSRQSQRFSDDYRTPVCLSHVHRHNDQMLRAHRRCYTDSNLTAHRAASRGFPILADSYRLDHRPDGNLARPKHENSNPYGLEFGELEHPHAIMAMPEAITDAGLTGSARLQQSFETRRRMRGPRNAMY